MPIKNNTPLESYIINGRKIFVKREDLSCPEGFPALSKLRGVEQRMLKLKEAGYTTIGVYDTRISKSGWGCAALASEIGGLKVINFYPHLIEYGDNVPENQQRVINLGHEIRPLKGGRTAVLYSQAKGFIENQQGGVMMPLGLVVEESIEATRLEAQSLPQDALGGDLVVCVGSGMMLAGIISAKRNFHCIYGISAGMNNDRQHKRIKDKGIEIPDNVDLLMSESDYFFKEEIETPFPCSPFYDKKAFRWMVENLDRLKDPLLFWNIGV